MRDEPNSSANEVVEEETIFLAIKDFLEKNAGAAVAHPVEPRTPLLNSSLDSFTVLQLMMFLSERFQFELKEEDFVEEHFGTVAALVSRITTKRSAT